MSNKLEAVAESPKEMIVGFHMYATFGYTVPNVASVHSMPVPDRLHCPGCDYEASFYSFIASDNPPSCMTSASDLSLMCPTCGCEGPFAEVTNETLRGND